jgi:transcriptional regulator with XRE-family HTH domain
MSNRLKEILRKKDISALELSRRTGIGASVIYNISNGKIIPYTGWKEKIANVLELPVTEIFPEGEGEPDGS